MNEEVHKIKEACLREMKDVCGHYGDEAHALHNFDKDEFEEIILEQWRPW